MLTRLLIARRDAAASAWIATCDSRTRSRLALWEGLLAAWTRGGTRRVS